MANIVGVSTESPGIEPLRVEDKYVFKVHFECKNCSYRFEQSFLKGDSVIGSAGFNSDKVLAKISDGKQIGIKCANCNSDTIDIRYRVVVGDNKKMEE